METALIAIEKRLLQFPFLTGFVFIGFLQFVLCYFLNSPEYFVVYKAILDLSKLPVSIGCCTPN